MLSPQACVEEVGLPFWTSAYHLAAMRKRIPGELAVIQTSWQDVLLLCRKCGRKLDGGFGEGGAETLKRVLREGLRQRGRRRDVRVMEVGCFGVCPKEAVMVTRGARPGTLVVVPREARMEVVLDQLLSEQAV